MREQQQEAAREGAVWRSMGAWPNAIMPASNVFQYTAAQRRARLALRASPISRRQWWGITGAHSVNNVRGETGPPAQRRNARHAQRCAAVKKRHAR